MKDQVEESKFERKRGGHTQARKRHGAIWHTSWPQEEGNERAKLATDAKVIWDRFVVMLKHLCWSGENVGKSQPFVMAWRNVENRGKDGTDRLGKICRINFGEEGGPMAQANEAQGN
jgi:hypothetical protein